MMENVNASKHGSTDTTEPQNLSLSFPTLPVDDSVADLVLVSHSNNDDDDDMRPAPPSRTPSEAASTLEDSTYDLVSNADLSESGILSDDDARTESLASFDGNTPDDVSLITSGDDTDEEGEVLNTPLDSVMLDSVHTQYSAASAEEPVVNITPTLDDSNYTSNTVRPSAEQSLSYIDFQVDEKEPSQANALSLCHVARPMSEVGERDELNVYDSRYAGVTMHLATANAPLRRSGPFRLLIVSSETDYNRDVAEHISAAVRLSPDDDPPVIVRYGVDAVLHKARSEIKLLTLVDAGQSVVTLRGGKAYQGDEPYPMWDLAVFLHTSLVESPHQEHMFQHAQLGLKSANVPVIHLSRPLPLFQAVPHSFAFDRGGLHYSVTTKTSKNSRGVVREMLPIDVDHFLDIDPCTLNKHLAFITKNTTDLEEIRRLGGNSSILKAVASLWQQACSNTKRVVEPHMRHVSRFIDGWTANHVIMALVLTLTTTLMCTSVYSLFTPQQSDHVLISPIASPTATPSTDMWSGLRSRLSGSDEVASSATPTVIATVKAKEEQARLEAKILQVMLQKAREDKELEMVSKAWKQYSLDAWDDRTFVLRAPAHLRDLIKRDPVLSVTNGGKSVNMQAVRMLEGEWRIEIPAAAAHGESILTMRAAYQLPHLGRYPFEYNFTIQHGKSSFEKVKDLVAQEFILVQDNVMELSTRMTTGLQHYLGDIQQIVKDETMKRVNETKKALVEFSNGEVTVANWESPKQRLRRLKKTKKAIRKQSKDIAEQIQATIVAAQDAMAEQYEEAMDVVRALSKWQQDTTWPVRAADWMPKTAAQRGLGNARGLLQKIRGTPKLIQGRQQRQECRQCARGRQCRKDRR